MPCSLLLHLRSRAVFCGRFMKLADALYGRCWALNRRVEVRDVLYVSPSLSDREMSLAVALTGCYLRVEKKGRCEPDSASSRESRRSSGRVT